MSGLFGNIGGFFQIMINSRGGRNHRGGYGCCHSGFQGSIWGGNIMPYSNPFGSFGGFNNFGSMMTPFGGYSGFDGFSGFGGFGGFDGFSGFNNFGSPSGGFNSGFNNVFGNFSGFNGIGNNFNFKSNNISNENDKKNSKEDLSVKSEDKKEIKTQETKQAESNKKTQEDVIKIEENTEVVNKPEVKNPVINKSDVTTPVVKQPLEETKLKEEVKKPLSAEEKAQVKAKEKAEENAETENYLRNKAKKLGIDVSNDNLETIREKVLANDPERAELNEKLAKPGKQGTLELNLRMIPDMDYDKETKVENGVTTITGKYSSGYEYKVIQNADGSYATYMDEDKDKKHGLDKDGWDRIIRRNQDGSGTVEQLCVDGTETWKYDNEQNNYNVTKTVKNPKTGVTEIYTGQNNDYSFDKKTVIDSKGTITYTWDKTKKDYVIK